MAIVTFTSPILHKDISVYATAGDNGTILALAKKHHVPIPFECQDGECGSCLIEVTSLSGKVMGQHLTEKEKSMLRQLGRITAEDVRRAEVDDISPKFRLACQYIVRDDDILVRFEGTPGGA